MGNYLGHCSESSSCFYPLLSATIQIYMVSYCLLQHLSSLAYCIICCRWATTRTSFRRPAT